MFRHTITAIITLISVLSLSIPVSAQGAEKGDAVLETIPADVIFCARINNLNQVTGVFDQFLTGIAPVSTSGLIKGPLTIMFGNPEMKGFDANGSFAIFGTAESNEAPPDIFFLLPVTDYKLLSDPNFRVSQPDTNGVSAVGTGPSGQFYISPVRSFAMMSKDYGKLKSMAALIKGGKTPALRTSLLTEQVMQSSTEPIWCYANMVKISALYGGLVSEGIEEIKKAQKENPQSQKQPFDVSQLMDAYGALLKDFMQQSKSITLVCNPRPAVLNLRVAVNALPGSEMAKTLSAEPATTRKNNLIGFTEDGAAMNFIGRTDHALMKKMYLKSIDVFAPMAGRDPNSPDIEKTKKLCVDMVDSMGDFVAGSFSIDPNAKPVFEGKYVFEVKDANLFNKTMDEFAQTWAGGVFNDFYKKMGMESTFVVKHGADNYKGISIDAATFNMKFNDTNSPESQMLSAMYGQGFNYRWAIVNGLWVCKVSSDPNAVYKVIDQVKAGAPSQACAEVLNAMKLIPRADGADAFFTLNYLRFLKVMLAMGPAPFTLPDIPTKSSLAFAVKIENGAITVDIAAPKEHIIEMSTAFGMIMQQQMQQQMKMQIQQQTGQTPTITPVKPMPPQN